MFTPSAVLQANSKFQSAVIRQEQPPAAWTASTTIVNPERYHADRTVAFNDDGHPPPHPFTQARHPAMRPSIAGVDPGSVRLQRMNATLKLPPAIHDF
jgi:hypothetical protein